MSSFSTSAILLRRIDFGDFDLITTFFTLNNGRLSAIAKNAQKSTKRFKGILEPFAFLNIVCVSGKGGRLPVLKEASSKQLFIDIRKDVEKTAYASYWTELINKWMEKGHKNKPIFYIFLQMLRWLDTGFMPAEKLSILFQIRFMLLSGFNPNLTYCIVCKTRTENIKSNKFFFDLGNGGIVCNKCGSNLKYHISFSKGTLKQLLWMQNKNFLIASKVKLSHQAVQEGLGFLEAFVPYHLGAEPKSLKFLRRIRKKE